MIYKNENYLTVEKKKDYLVVKDEGLLTKMKKMMLA